MNREPTEKEIEMAKEMVYEDAAADFGGHLSDFHYALTSFEKKAFTKAVMQMDDAEIGRLFRLGFDRAVLKDIDLEAYDMARGWQEFGERA